jgi:dihydrodipicolinate reductase
MQTMDAPSTEKRIDDLNSRMAEGFGRVHRELDGLNARTTEGFKRVDREIDRVCEDIRELRGDIGKLRQETNVRFETVDARFDAMHRTMNRGFFAIGSITVTLFLALAGLQGF